MRRPDPPAPAISPDQQAKLRLEKAADRERWSDQHPANEGVVDLDQHPRDKPHPAPLVRGDVEGFRVAARVRQAVSRVMGQMAFPIAGEGQPQTQWRKAQGRVDAPAAYRMAVDQF